MSGATTYSGVTKAGSGTLTITGSSIYSGPTTVSGGILQAGSLTALSANSAFTVISELDLNGNSNVIGSLAGGGIVSNNGVAPAILTAGGDGTNTVFSGTLTDGFSRVSAEPMNPAGPGLERWPTVALRELSGARLSAAVTIFTLGI